MHNIRCIKKTRYRNTFPFNKKQTFKINIQSSFYDILYTVPLRLATSNSKIKTIYKLYIFVYLNSRGIQNEKYLIFFGTHK